MEGGEGNRKGGIDIDWGRLLNSDKDEGEPPQLVVEKNSSAAKKRIRKSTGMEDGCRDLQADEMFRGMSDMEVETAIGRMKRTLSITKMLPDGGEKYRRNIKRHEDELERRRLLKRQKDDEKCRQPTEFHELSCSGACDGSQDETSPRSNYGSDFATRFRKRIENKTDHKKEITFGKELSVLNPCDLQRTRSNGNHLSKEKHKGGLSSRQTQFQCPSTLSPKVDKQNLSNGDQKGQCSTTASPHDSKDDSATRVRKKRGSLKLQKSGNRVTDNTVVLVDEDETDIAETTQEVDQDDECMKEARVYYPSRDDSESIEIRYSDLKCLAPEAFLSSTIMNFYIRYLQQHRYSMSKRLEDYHFFNTYFYQKLREAVQKKNDSETLFAKMRRWWKGVRLFEKAYIFLPIHENLHWSLVIICIPGVEDETGPIILHLDSLRLHSSKLIFENIRRFLIGEWEFLRNEEVLPDLPIPNKIWENFPRRIDEKIIEVPQQRNDYDCGLFVLYFIENFIQKAPERVKKKELTMFGRQWFKPEEASSLRRTIRNLLRDEFKKAKENNRLLNT